MFYCIDHITKSYVSWLVLLVARKSIGYGKLQNCVCYFGYNNELITGSFGTVALYDLLAMVQLVSQEINSHPKL